MIFVDDENRFVPDHARFENRIFFRKLHDRNKHDKLRAFLIVAVNSNRSPHQGCEPPTDRQTQPCAAETAGCGGIRLAEGEKYAPLFVLGNSNAGILDREHESMTTRQPGLPSQRDNHLAAHGKFQGIPHEVNKNLTEADIVPANPVQVVGQEARQQLDFLFCSHEAIEVQYLLDTGPQ